MNLHKLAELAQQVYPENKFPKPLDALMALQQLQAEGQPLESLKHHMRKRVAPLVEARDPVQTAYQVDLADLPAKVQQRARKGELMLGQLVLGTLAEQAFEEIYHRELGTSEFRLDDYRESRNDTDYRMLNGGGRPLFRINSKFHGSQFRRAKELVGLEPADCFALATYKIWSAIEKQKAESMPYLFIVISSPITSESVANEVPAEVRELVRLVHAAEKAEGKRDLEERIVNSLLLADTGAFGDKVRQWREQLAGSRWRVLSAWRADKLLRDLLFERVFAVRTRNFTQSFRNAELDMHFSLANDMLPLEDMLNILKREGSQGVVGRAMQGKI